MDEVMTTRLKIILINGIIVLGVIAIAILQVPQARKDIGNADDVGGTLLLSILTVGLIAVAWSTLAYLLLTWLLMRSGEMDDYRAQQEIARLPKEPPAVEKQPHDLIE